MDTLYQAIAVRNYYDVKAGTVGCLRSRLDAISARDIKIFLSNLLYLHFLAKNVPN